MPVRVEFRITDPVLDKRVRQLMARATPLQVVAKGAMADVIVTDVIDYSGRPSVVLCPAAEVARALAAGASFALPLDASARMIEAAAVAAGAGLTGQTKGRTRERGAALDGVDPDETASPGALLSARELEVLRLMADGASNKLIARRLSISVHTAKFHVGSIMGKLGATTRTDAVAKGMRLGLVLL